MSAPYDARIIANLLLDEFDSRIHEITNKKINKILYFVHGIGLVRLGYPLIRNHFEAWEHGPVVSVLYASFKDCKFLPIDRRATAFNYVSSRDEILRYDQISTSDREFILRVARYYMRFNADELVQMTHALDTPWATVRATPAEERGVRNRIPDSLVFAYFAARLGEPKNVN